MMRVGLIMGVLACFFAIGPSSLQAETVDEKFKKLKPDQIKVKDHTRDACDKADDITVTSTTDGNVVIKPGDTKYFKIKKDDDYTRSGGFYFKCGGTGERARLKGATYIKAVRLDSGPVDWYRVEIEID